MFSYGEFNQNCPPNKIVTTENVCKEAAVFVGANYDGTVEKSIWPAGCFGDEVGNVFFNTIIDPSKTSPAYEQRGVCIETGILFRY